VCEILENLAAASSFIAKNRRNGYENILVENNSGCGFGSGGSYHGQSFPAPAVGKQHSHIASPSKGATDTARPAEAECRRIVSNGLAS